MTRIAQTRKSDVYIWGDNKILKLLRKSNLDSNLGLEAKITRMVKRTNLDVPDVNGIVEIDGRQGIIFEYIEGSSILRRVKSKPWMLIQSAWMLAELHASIHNCIVPGLPSQRRKMEKQIQNATILPADVRKIALNVLDQLPAGKVLCHGDFHPSHVILSSCGNFIVDWADASQGNPLADVAKTFLSIPLGHLPSNVFGKWLLKSARTLFSQISLRRYLQLTSASRQKVAAWQLPVAAAMLSKNLSPKRTSQLLAFVETFLSSRSISEIN